jgi:hypothetical protein
MTKKLSLQDLSRQPLVRGTSCFTDPSGNVGYKNEDLQVSALVRIAAALEEQTQALKEPNPLSLAEYGELHVLLTQAQPRLVASLVVAGEPDESAQLVRLCELVQKLLSGLEGGQPNG